MHISGLFLVYFAGRPKWFLWAEPFVSSILEGNGARFGPFPCKLLGAEFAPTIRVVSASVDAALLPQVHKLRDPHLTKSRAHSTKQRTGQGDNFRNAA